MITNQDLYKDPVNGKIAGVCAGFANYFNIPVWIIRVLVIYATLFGGAFVTLLLYVGLTLLLETEPSDNLRFSNIRARSYNRADIWKKGATATEVLQTIEQELKTVEKQIIKLESYTQSDAFRIDRAFR